MPTVKASSLSRGDYITHKGRPHKVEKSSFFSPGKGAAVVRMRLRDAKTGQVSDVTFRTTEGVESVDVTKKELQFLYADDLEAVFMDARSYDQFSVQINLVQDQLGFLTPETSVHVLFYEGKPLGVQMPPNVVLKVTQAPDAVAGDRINSPKKPVILETGHEIQVPLFIKTGDKISVDTSSGEYLARVK